MSKRVSPYIFFPPYYKEKYSKSVCVYYSLYWSSRPAWRRASSSGSSCSPHPLSVQSTHLNHTNTHEYGHTHTHMCTNTNRASLGVSRAGNKCKPLTCMEPCLSTSVTEVAVSHCSFSLHYIRLLLFLTNSSTHLADRLTRKFHSLADTHTHTPIRFHSDTPPSSFSHREGEEKKVCLPITMQHSPQLSALLLLLPVQITVRQV